MDSQVTRDVQMIDIVDDVWRKDELPDEDIAVPQMELPELEQENGPSTETLTEQEQKWSDLALPSLSEQPSSSTSNTS